MEFVHREVLAILFSKHGIERSNKVAFQGRLQHIQRLGFPPGINTGKGRPARYTWRELLLLGLVFEYLEIGSTPDRCIAEIIKFEDIILIGLANVLLMKSEDAEIDKLNCFLCTELSGLLTLKIEDRWNQKCNILSLYDINEILSVGGNDAYRSPYAIIDLRQFIGGMVTSVIDICGLNNDIVANDIKLWAYRLVTLPA